MKDLLQKLNENQLKAVQAVEGPVMVFAGAGTGKTRTLIARIIHMIEECKIPASSILAITFTKKATGEMRERLKQSLGQETARWVKISTIHSLCNRILRRHINYLGYSRDFEIIDDEEMAKILAEIYRGDAYTKKMYPPKTMVKIIGDYKSGMRELKQEEQDFYDRYTSYIKQNNMIDLDDLLLLTNQLLEQYPEVLSYWQQEFKYILVDEYQDTNKIQYEIIKKLASSHHNIFAVGDDDQSIYSFRGACVDNMFSFMEDYPDAQVITLDQNYRSSQTILKGANSLIKNNQIRQPKELFSAILGQKGDVTIHDAYYYEDEIRYVVNEIAHLVYRENYHYEDIAILYRNNALSRNFELALLEDKIPYTIYGGFSYMKRREIKDIISYLRFILNPVSGINFQRVIERPSRGIGDKTLAKVYECMAEKDISLFDAIKVLNEENPSTKFAVLDDFRKIITNLRAKLETSSLVAFFEEMIEETGYLAMLRQEDTDEQNRVSNVKEFESILYNFDESYRESDLTQVEKLQRCLDDVVLDQAIGDEEAERGIVLSTIHSVKGLEFRAVFLVGLEEGIFPAIREDVDLEEERRVAYVAVTRAKEKLYLTCAERRLIYGRIVRNQKSCFLTEFLVSEEFKKMIEEKVAEKMLPTELHIGSKVNHTYFGYGTVIEIDDRFVKILFEKDSSIKKIGKNHPTLVGGK